MKLGRHLTAKNAARRSRNPGSADFQVCCGAGFQTRRLHDCGRSADWEVGDTAGLETCATKAGGRCLEKSSWLVTILTDSSAKSAKRKKAGNPVRYLTAKNAKSAESKTGCWFKFFVFSAFSVVDSLFGSAFSVVDSAFGVSLRPHFEKLAPPLRA
jgi:hypothetical protein